MKACRIEALSIIGSPDELFDADLVPSAVFVSWPVSRRRGARDPPMRNGSVGVDRALLESGLVQYLRPLRRRTRSNSSSVDTPTPEQMALEAPRLTSRSSCLSPRRRTPDNQGRTSSGRFLC